LLTPLTEDDNFGQFRTIAENAAKLIYSDDYISLNFVPTFVTVIGFLLSLPFVTNIINASYSSVRQMYKPSHSYSAPHHGYGRSDDYDYYDYGDYDNKYDRYDDEKKFRRRGRPIGRMDEDDYFDNWRKSDYYNSFKGKNNYWDTKTKGSKDYWDRQSKEIPTDATLEVEK